MLRLANFVSVRFQQQLIWFVTGAAASGSYSVEFGRYSGKRSFVIFPPIYMISQRTCFNPERICSSSVFSLSVSIADYSTLFAVYSEVPNGLFYWCYWVWAFGQRPIWNFLFIGEEYIHVFIYPLFFLINHREMILMIFSLSFVSHRYFDALYFPSPS